MTIGDTPPAAFAAALNPRFAARVRAFRLARGGSQERLAERTDLHRTYISAVEQARHRVSLLTVCKLAHGLEESVASLLDLGEQGGEAQRCTLEAAVEVRLRACSNADLREVVKLLDFLGRWRTRGRLWTRKTGEAMAER